MIHRASSTISALALLPALLPALLATLASVAVAQPGASPSPVAAGPATASPAARALVVHVAPASVAPGAPVDLSAMIDAPFAEVLTARWRAIGSATWHDVPFERSSAGGWFASLPSTRPPGLEYYLRGQDAAGAEVLHFASAAAPHVVRVDPSLTDRLEELDRVRLAGRVDEVSLDVMGHEFGNRYDSAARDLSDRYLRGELTYTHRLLRTLHHIAFGFGAIQGTTPLYVDESDRRNLDKGMRYGFGEIRLRAHPSVFVDLRLALGVSHEGFDQGARAAVTFGKPWRSSVTVGGEAIGDLGASAWVRLQWDTAPPLLMGASIVRTDLPGALVDAAGLYIAYDVAYRLDERFTVRAQLSYGARDGSAHLGGGLGTAVAF